MYKIIIIATLRACINDWQGLLKGLLNQSTTRPNHLDRSYTAAAYCLEAVCLLSVAWDGVQRTLLLCHLHVSKSHQKSASTTKTAQGRYQENVGKAGQAGE